MDLRARILPPYTQRVDDLRHRLTRLLLAAGLVMLAMFMGLLIAMLPQQMVLIPAVPVLVLMGVALWMLPERDMHLDGKITGLYLVFFAVSLLWPDYVAFVFPGIGWISPMRLTMGLTFFLSLYALSSAPRMRREMLETASHFRPMWLSFIAFFIIQLLLTLGTARFDNRWVYINIFWYYMFLLTAWLFRQEGVPRRFAQIFPVATAIQGFYGIWEHQYGRPLWADHIPPFMQVDPVLLSTVLSPVSRAGSDVLRITSIYLTSITYAEFIALALPFVIFFMLFGKRLWARLATIPLVVLMLLNAVWTDSRSAMAGIVISLFGIVGLLSVRRYWRLRHQPDLLGAAAFWSFPAIAVAGLAAILAVDSLRVRVLGGAQHQSSNGARSEQWRIALHKLTENPIGHGPFSASEVVHYTNLAGKVTIDSFPIGLLMDYGVAGFLTFSAFFLAAAWLAVRTFMRADDSEEMLAAPVAVALIAFIVIKTVLFQSENHYLAFSLVGLAAALAWRQDQRLKAEAEAAAGARPAAPEALVRPVRPRGILI
jgi:ABC-type multidrug transport system fused ATPase/permease subunit